MRNFILTICFIFMFSTISKSETYICERQISSGITFSEIQRKWVSTSSSIDKNFKNFSITPVTEEDYKDKTFSMFDMMSVVSAETLKPKYKIVNLYKNNSKSLKVCLKDFNTNGLLFCGNSNLILNKKNSRFEEYISGGYVHGCDIKGQKFCGSGIIYYGVCNKL